MNPPVLHDCQGMDLHQRSPHLLLLILVWNLPLLKMHTNASNHEGELRTGTTHLLSVLPRYHLHLPMKPNDDVKRSLYVITW